MAAGCPQAWHGGLPAGLLVECRFKPGHRSWHRNADGTMQWSGKLTAGEKTLATRLRSAAA
jgi:hypothetical protein